MSDGLWEQVGECFANDDGSLPGILVANLSSEGVAGIYATLRARSRIAGEEPPEFWSITEGRALPVDSVTNAAALVVSGQAEPFHHCIKGVIAAGVALPVLGLFVSQDAIQFDYRMGAQWGPAEVEGFFDLLRDCCAIDPGGVVLPAQCEGPPYPDRFAQAWATYNKAGKGYLFLTPLSAGRHTLEFGSSGFDITHHLTATPGG
jgi:hypothetical protein